MSVSCVYWIRCADHTDLMTQGYVGVSGRFDRRMWEHMTLTGNRHLKNAINKHGWDNLLKTQILIAEDDYCLDIERKLRPSDKIGWNLTAGGGKPPSALGKRYKTGKPSWNKGVKMATESVEKVRQAVKDLWQDPAYREHMSNVHKGQKCAMEGKRHKAESIEKMRQTKLGKPSKKKGVLLTDEQKQNLSQQMRSNPWTCPHCQKTGYGVGAKNRWHFDNCKLKGN